MKSCKSISLPLLLINENEIVSVVELRGGNVFKEKCLMQGIVPGQQLQVINKQFGKSMVVGINGMRIIIGGGMVSRIMVRKIS